MRHTAPRLTASVYTDEKLLPLAAELVNVPAIGDSPAVADGHEERDLAALAAALTAEQRQQLLRALRTNRAG